MRLMMMLVEHEYYSLIKSIPSLKPLRTGIFEGYRLGNVLFFFSLLPLHIEKPVQGR